MLYKCNFCVFQRIYSYYGYRRAYATIISNCHEERPLAVIRQSKVYFNYSSIPRVNEDTLLVHMASLSSLLSKKIETDTIRSNTQTMLQRFRQMLLISSNEKTLQYDHLYNTGTSVLRLIFFIFIIIQLIDTKRLSWACVLILAHVKVANWWGFALRRVAQVFQPLAFIKVAPWVLDKYKMLESIIRRL